MKIIIDTREKSPLKFKHEYITEVINEKLNIGDYRALYENGKQSSIIVERKSIGDLFGTLTSGYVRFRKEIERAKQDNISLIICIEGNYRKVKDGYKHCGRPGGEIADQLRTIWAKYGVIHHYCVDRSQMTEYIIDTFIWCGKKEIWG